MDIGYQLIIPTQTDGDEFLSDQPTPIDGGALCWP